jgi:hypothetical protein
VKAVSHPHLTAREYALHGAGGVAALPGAAASIADYIKEAVRGLGGADQVAAVPDVGVVDGAAQIVHFQQPQEARAQIAE